MVAMSNPAFAEGFEWDDEEEDTGNTAHLARHGITPVEAEEVYYNRGVFARNKREGSGDWLLVGSTTGGRTLTLILSYDPTRRIMRIFTGWDATPRERAKYLS